MIMREMAKSVKESKRSEERIFEITMRNLTGLFQSTIFEGDVSAVNENLYIRGHLGITRTITRGVRSPRERYLYGDPRIVEK